MKRSLLRPGNSLAAPALLVLAIWAAAPPKSQAALTTPCDTIERRHAAPAGWVFPTASAEWLNRQLPPNTAPLDAKAISFLQSFSFEGWQIIEVETHVSDEPYLFFRGNPQSATPITLWSGGATVFDNQSIRRWTTKNAPGIPKRLADCFVWSVTPRR